MVQVLRIWTCDGSDVRKHLTKNIFPALVAISRKAGEGRTIRCIQRDQEYYTPVHVYVLCCCCATYAVGCAILKCLNWAFWPVKTFVDLNAFLLSLGSSRKSGTPKWVLYVSKYPWKFVLVKLCRVNLRWDRTNPDYFGNSNLSFFAGGGKVFIQYAILFAHIRIRHDSYLRFALDEFILLTFAVMNYTFSSCVAQTDLFHDQSFPWHPDRLRTWSTSGMQPIHRPVLCWLDLDPHRLHDSVKPPAADLWKHCQVVPRRAKSKLYTKCQV